jgi:hypothetical protein
MSQKNVTTFKYQGLGKSVEKLNVLFFPYIFIVEKLTKNY